MVQPDRGRKVLKDDCRAQFMVRELHGPEDAAVLQCLEQAELSFGGAPNRFAAVLPRFRLGKVNANSPDGVLQPDMAAEEILEARPLVQQLMELVVSNVS